MPKQSWSAFIEFHRAAHLVAGVIPEPRRWSRVARHSGNEQWHRVSNWTSPEWASNDAGSIGVARPDSIQSRSVGGFRMNRAAGLEVAVTDRGHRAEARSARRPGPAGRDRWAD